MCKSEGYDSTLLQALKSIIDMMSLLVVCFVYLSLAYSIRLRRNTEFHTSLVQELDQPIAVIGFVGKARDPFWDIVT